MVAIGETITLLPDTRSLPSYLHFVTEPNVFKPHRGHRIMQKRYLELFRAPGAAGFFVAGFIARMAGSMTSIGIIIMLSQLRGSYALAGAVTATFVLTRAVVAPQISRLVDRHGQGKAMPVAAMICILGIVGLIVVALNEAPSWLLFVCAVPVGFGPSISSMTRARWTAIYRGMPELRAAYSLESVFDEVSYIAGPPVAIALSVAGFPQAPLMVASAVLALGVFGLAAQKSTEPPPRIATVDQDGGSAILNGGVAALGLLLVTMGMIGGTISIGSVAFAESEGQPGMASMVLTAYAVSSLIAGLGFGALRLGVPLPRLLLLGFLATAASTVPFVLVGNVTALAVAVFVSGLFWAPTMIVATALVERLVPEARLTEGLTWLMSGLSIGSAIGSALTGQVVDAHGAQNAFGAAIAAGIAILLLAPFVQSVISTRLNDTAA